MVNTNGYGLNAQVYRTIPDAALMATFERRPTTDWAKSSTEALIVRVWAHEAADGPLHAHRALKHFSEVVGAPAEGLLRHSANEMRPRPSLTDYRTKKS
ncbi:hypothetical protein ATO6_02825 [Oceanicola sp. 22II-s10i]|nr:hypothetical protein ATO6_02825 [Oceanicola sp. 22II-s10i]